MDDLTKFTDQQLIMLMLIKLGYRVDNDSLVNALIEEMENRLNRSYEDK